MLKINKSALLIIVTSLLISFVGCSSSVQLNLEEVKNKTNGKIVSIIKPTDISGVILASDSLVNFNELKGKYNPTDKTITGTTNIDQEVIFGVDDVKYVVLQPVSGVSTTLAFVGFTQMIADQNNVQTDKIKIGSPIWDFIKFTKTGAALDIKGNMLRGDLDSYGERDQYVTSLDDIKAYEYKAEKTIRRSHVGATIAVIAFIIIEGFDVLDK